MLSKIQKIAKTCPILTLLVVPASKEQRMAALLQVDVVYGITTSTLLKLICRDYATCLMFKILHEVPLILNNGTISG